MNPALFASGPWRRQSHYPERVTFSDAVRDPSMTLDEFVALMPRYQITDLQPDGRDIPPEDLPGVWKCIQYERARELAESMPPSTPLHDRLRIARELYGLDPLGL